MRCSRRSHGDSDGGEATEGEPSAATCALARLVLCGKATVSVPGAPMASIRTTPSPSPRPPERRHWRSVAFECVRRPELNQWERQFLGTRANWKGGRITQKQPDCLWRVLQRLGLRTR